MATSAGPARPHHTMPRAVEAFQRFADALALAATYLAAACLFALTFLVLAEVALGILNRLFKVLRLDGLPKDIPIAWEYSAYLMGAAFMLGSGLTLRAGMHVRVELLLQGGKARQARRYELLSSLIGTLVTVLMAWTFTAFAIRSFLSTQLSQDSFTPLWIPQAPLALGAIVLALQMIARLLACVFGGPTENPAFRVVTSTTE
jgi:TRAP-type mannitol/chloroaromatic compound transport system permease small subunit